jgi:transcriptional repressor NrdR
MAANFNCPMCGESDNTCIDSRPIENGIRRRRECNACGHRWNTYEFSEATWMENMKRYERGWRKALGDSEDQA